MKTVRSLLILVFATLVFTLSAYATAPDLKVIISRPDGDTRLSGMSIQVSNPMSMNPTRTGFTDSDGKAIFNLSTEQDGDTFEVRVRPANSGGFYQNGKFRETEVDVVVAFSHPNLISSDPDNSNLPTVPLMIELDEASRVIGVQFLNPVTDNPTVGDPTMPLVAQTVTAAAPPLPSQQIFTTATDDNGRAFFPLEMGTTGGFLVQAASQSNAFANVNEIIFVPPGTSNVLREVVLVKTDASLRVQYLGSNQDNFSVPAGVQAKVDCFSLSEPALRPFSVQIAADNSEGIIPVKSNQDGYNCVGHLSDNFAVQSVQVPGPILEDEQVEVDLQVLAVDGSVEFSFTDSESGLPIDDSDLKVQVSIFPMQGGSDNDLNFSANGIYSNGSMSPIPLPTGQSYQPFIKVIRDQFSTEIEPFYVPLGVLDPFSLEDSDSSDLEISVPLRRTDSHFQVTVLNPDGSPVTSGFVSASVDNASSQSNGDLEFERFEITGRVNSSGVAVLPVFSDIEYQLRGGPVLEEQNPAADGDTINPGIIRATPTSGEVSTLTLQILEPNFTISVTPTVVDENGNTLSLNDALFVGCGVRTGSDKRNGSSAINDDGTISVPIHLASKKKRNALGVGCRALYAGEDESSNGVQYFGRSSIKSKKGNDTASIEVTLEPAGVYYPQQMETFTPSDSKSFILPDGKTTLEAGSGAFGSGDSAEITFGTATDTFFGDEYIPLTLFDITITVDDEEVEEPDQSVQYCLDVTQETLDEYGVSQDAVKIARYDDTTGEFIESETTVTTNDDGSFKFCADIQHFSTWGTIIDVIEELQETVPTSFRVAKKGKKVQFRWQDAGDVDLATTSYLLEFATNVRTRKQCKALLTFSRSRTIVGNSIKIRARKRRYCARVSVEQGTPTEAKFRKIRR